MVSDSNDKCSRRATRLVALAVFLATLALFSRTARHGFINFDDQGYVTENARVQAGLTMDGLYWAFTTFHTGNWHPLTWLSLEMDASLSPRDPRTGDLPAAWFHLSNAGLHAATATVLFLALARMTGALWGSAMAAGLFGLHPLRVESVAWIAERKDVLSGFFGMLTIWAYVGYAQRPALGRYAWVTLAFALALLAKPMLVTLPFVLLLLDYWPLGRAGKTAPADEESSPSLRGWGWLVVEKAPLLLLAMASAIITLRAQRAGKAIRSWEELGLTLRLENAVRAYGAYLRKMFWPVDLGLFYPHPVTSFAAWQVAGAIALLGIVTVFALALGRRKPYVLVGWLWYLGTMVPVIGLVQVGGQALADRYTYFPSIGLVIMVVWTARAGSVGLKCMTLVGAAGVAAVGACTALTWVQLGYWRNSEVLWKHTLQVAGPSALAHTQFGVALAERGELDAALEQFRAALRSRSDYWLARLNLALVLTRQGRYADSILEYRQVLALNPENAQACLNLGAALVRTHHLAEGTEQMVRALEIRPHYQAAARGLGEIAWLMATSPDPAWRNGSRAVQLAEMACNATDYHDPRILDALAAAYAEVGRFGDAMSVAEQALQATPSGGERGDRLSRAQSYRSHRPFRTTSPPLDSAAP